MEIRNITIHNFRSIIDATIYLKDYTLLVGANNTGKSNVIDAIMAFYEKSNTKYDPSRDVPKLEREDDEAWMDIEYELDSKEAVDIKSEYLLPNNHLKVRKYFKQSGERKAGIYGFEGEELSDSFFYGAKGVQQGKLGDIIYIPAVSRIEDETKTTGPSPFRAILTDIFENLVSSSLAYENFTKEFDEFTSEFMIEKTEDNKSIVGLEKEINDEIKEWELEFDIDINPVDQTNIIKNLIDYKIVDKHLGEKVTIHQQGHGFQRHLIYTLIRISTRYQTKGSPQKAKDFVPNMKLILFEEPEAFLHPSQQDLLGISLQQITSHSGNQALIATHSPNFVSRNSFHIPSIVHLCRDEKARTLVGQISPDVLTNIFDENQEINEILMGTSQAAEDDDLTEDMEAIKYFMWLNPDRCGLFFAKFVLLVEGTTEKVLFNFLIDNERLKIPLGGLYILDCFGKFNIHRFMNILGGLKIRHSVLLDADDHKGYHEDIKKLIIKSKNSFTNKIGEFPSAIEDFLGIDKPKKPRRKPQHVLFRVKEGKVTDEIIDKLIEMVDDLLVVDKV